MTRPTRRLGAAAVLSLALAGCADPASVGQEPPSASASGAGPVAADGVVLRVSYEGGMLPAGTIPELPFWSLYGDGRVITRGPEPAIFPGQALPNVQVGTVTSDTVERIAAAARAAGVDGEQRDYGDPPVADASTTVFRLSDEHGTVETKVYALAEGDDTLANDPRRKLRDFLRRLTAAEPDGGFGAVSDEQAYDPAAVAVYATTYREPDAGADLEPQEVAWTGADPATGADTRAGRCLLLTGDALAKALPSFRQANALTRWRAGSAAWAFRLRPLLPDESTCADGLR